RIHRISQIRFVGAHRAEVVADLDSLAGSEVHVNLRTISQQKIEVLGQHNSPAVSAVARTKAIKPFRQVECDRLLFRERYRDVSGNDVLATEFDTRHSHFAASVNDAYPTKFRIGLAHRL